MATLVVARAGGCTTHRYDNEDDAHDRAGELWFDDPAVLGVVVFNDLGNDRGRYERPGATLPADWPARDITYTGRELEADLDAPRQGPAPGLPAAVVVDLEAAVPACGCCSAPLRVERYDGDDDPTPSGRIERYRCPECGAQMTGTRQEIERRYMATRTHTVAVTQPGDRPRPQKPPRDWRRG